MDVPAEEPAQPEPDDAPTSGPAGSPSPASPASEPDDDRDADREGAGQAAHAPASGRPPAGDVYDWYQRGLRLLGTGDAAAAAEVLAHASAASPESSSIREALGRARLGSRRYALARDDFAQLVGDHPDDDFAHYGLGLALSRLGRWPEAVEQLALACALRPEREDYARELAHARATWRAQPASGSTAGEDS